MFKKNCSNCETISYSNSSKEETWLCPTCQHDISDVEPINILAFETME